MFHYDFVENLMAHLLVKESAQTIKQQRSYNQNTETAILYGPPVRNLAHCMSNIIKSKILGHNICVMHYNTTR